MSTERLQMSSRYSSEEFKNSGIAYEVNFSLPQLSLFASIGLTIFEIILRFEGFTISDSITANFTLYISNYVATHRELESNMHYLFEFIKQYRDTSLDTFTRIHFLNYYFQLPDLPENTSWFLRALIREQLTDDFLKNQIDQLNIDTALIKSALIKVAEMFGIGFILYSYQSEAEVICPFSDQVPFGVLYVTADFGVRVLYTNEMIKVEENPKNLESLLFSLVIDRETKPKNKFSCLGMMSGPNILPKLENSGKDSINKNEHLINYASEAELKRGAQRNAVIENIIPPQSQPLQEDIIEYISYTLFLLCQQNLYHESLNSHLQDLSKKYPELEGIAKINFSPSSQADFNEPIILNPPGLPQVKEDPLFNEQREQSKQISNNQKNNRKICIICFNEKVDEDFSDFGCEECAICNRCRTMNLDYCEMCHRKYSAEEKTLIGMLKEVNLKISELFGRDSIGRTVQKFAKCKSHEGLEQDENYSKEFICCNECFACNKCRMKDMRSCIVCKRRYNENEFGMLQVLKIGS